MFKGVFFLIFVLSVKYIRSDEKIFGEVDNESVCQRTILKPIIEYFDYVYNCCIRVRVRCKRSGNHLQQFGYNCHEFQQRKCTKKRKMCKYVEREEKFCCNGFKLVNGICKKNETQNDCSKCQHSCRIINGKATCICLPGYKLEAKYECIDINECDNKTKCGNAGCQNIEGSFFCKCKSGFELKNATYCADINECANNNTCQDKCVNTIGSHHCECPKGLKSKGSICIDINECTLTNRGGCSHDCKNLYGSYQCTCPSNMTLGSNNHTCYSSITTSEMIESSSFHPSFDRQKEEDKKNTDGALAGIILACIIGTILLILLIIVFYKKGWCNCCMAGIGVVADSPKKVKSSIENDYIDVMSKKEKISKTQEEQAGDEENDRNIDSFYVNRGFKMPDSPPNYKDVLDEIKQEQFKNDGMEDIKIDKEVESKKEINKEEPIYGNLTNEAEAEAVYVNVSSMG